VFFMDISNFKNIIGEAKRDEVATIRFFGRVTEESTSQFNAEFDYLESVIQPKLIRVLINSEGGSVFFGMTTYSTIQNSTIPTECIIEGMAASMGSIIWAAGERSLMRDYSILMIHNPFLPEQEKVKSEPTDLIRAFTKQIETIYRKRFGLKAEHVRAIMKGEAEKDGTFFDATSAVKAGIIPKEAVINTSAQICERVKSELSKTDDISKIQQLMAEISAETDFKPFVEQPTILKETGNNSEKMSTTQKTNSPEYAAVAATLGLKDEFEVNDVMARINTLISTEAKLKETEKSLTDAQTVIAGKDASITNLQKDLATATASLTTYQNKEKAEREERIETMVENAVLTGRIPRDKKADWVKMAEDNIELAESTLASIPEREQISKEIATDPDNIQAAKDATKGAEAKMAEQVTAVVGENFEFQTLK
ncbi:MAG: ATP-dependent Clp protease proteolytic subunit, partial [Rikenellaceae bacterium]